MSDDDPIRPVLVCLGVMFGVGLLGATIGTFVNTTLGIVVMMGGFIFGGLSLCRIGLEMLRR
jgi:hypothetical protein